MPTWLRPSRIATAFLVTLGLLGLIVVELQKLEALPLVGRNVMALAASRPGINGIPGSTDFLSTGQGLGIAASGGRGSGNNAMVDGI